MNEMAMLRRVHRAAWAVLLEWEAYRGDMLLMQKMKELREAFAHQSGPQGVVWETDPHKKFGRVGGRLVATVKEMADGTWTMVTDDGRHWPAFRSAEAAEREYEQFLANRACAVSAAKAVV